MIGIQIYDSIQKNLPDVGILRIRDAETGYEQYLDTSNKAVRKAHGEYWQKRASELKQMFQRNSVDYVSVSTDEDFVKALRVMFASF